MEMVIFYADCISSKGLLLIQSAVCWVSLVQERFAHHLPLSILLVDTESDGVKDNGQLL